MTTPSTLIQPRVWRGVARRLAQWHAVLPIKECVNVTPEQDEQESEPDPLDVTNPVVPAKPSTNTEDITPITPRQEGPNLWTVLQKWILALPVATDQERLRRKQLQQEVERIVGELDDGEGLGEGGVS